MLLWTWGHMYLFELVFSLVFVHLPPDVGRDMHPGNDCLCPDQRVCASLFPLSVCALVGSGSLYYSGGRCQSKKSWSRGPVQARECAGKAASTRLFPVCCLSTVLEQGGRWGWGGSKQVSARACTLQKQRPWFLAVLQQALPVFKPAKGLICPELDPRAGVPERYTELHAPQGRSPSQWYCLPLLCVAFPPGSFSSLPLVVEKLLCQSPRHFQWELLNM